MESIKTLLLLSLLLIVILGYLLPGIVASKRGHPQTGPIVIINIFLGWSLIGWVVALAWAASDFKKAREFEGYEIRDAPHQGKRK